MKQYLLFIFIFLSKFTFSQTWQSIGPALNGNNNNIQFGRSAQLSGNGSVAIIGSEINTLNSTGKAQVFNWNGTNWLQKGMNIVGQGANDGCGESVSISTDGNTIAVGSPSNDLGGLDAGSVRIYFWNGTSWIQKGLSISGSVEDYSGYKIHLSGDGNSIIISSAGSINQGKVKVYYWSGSNWIQKGGDFIGQNQDDFFGSSVNLSNDGNTVAIGSSAFSGIASFGGIVKLFEWNGITWTQKGSDILGTNPNQYLGASISLTGNGNTIAIGSPNNNTGTGIVQVYKWIVNGWVQEGLNITGSSINEYFGSSVSINGNGNLLAVGIPGKDGIGDWDGETRTYSLINTNWVYTANSISSNSQNAYSGSVVSLDDTGNTLLVTEPSNSTLFSQGGKVTFHEFCNQTITFDNQNACDSFTWADGITYTSSNNTSTISLQSQNGCDSIIQLNLIITNSNFGVDNQINCDNFTWIDGVTYNFSTNTPTYVLQNINGCDSIVNLNLTITNNANPISDYVCGGPYIWNNQLYSTSGTYTQTFQAANGCDSVVTLNLTINNDNFNPSLTSNQQLFTSPPFAVQFSNTTANIGNYNFTWFWGDGTSTTSNNPTVFHEYLSNGLYTVTLQATNTTTGCTDESTYTDYIFTTGGVSCTHTATINQTGTINSCSGQPVILTCNSDPNFTYQWRKNGIYIPGNNNDSLIVTQSGSYSVIISVNGCPVASTSVSVNFQSITQPTITSSGTIQPCIGGSVTLSASSGYSGYLWSNGSSSPSIIVNTSGNYTVQATGSNGCTSTSAPYTINASFLPTQNICVVGVDSLTSNIRVVWEEPITTAIDSFYIYKESNVSNVYTQVGTRAYDSLSVWIDPISNPAVQSYRYKITALDTCGVETPVSDFHKTIHLTINQGVGGAWNLIWSHYEGINFGSYNIYRGTSSSNMTLLTTIQSNLNSYTDLAPPTGAVYYQIEIVNPTNCTPTKSTNYSSSKSNIATNDLNNIEEFSSEFISVYPNPTSSDLTIEITKGLMGEEFTITDFYGRILKTGTFDSSKQKVDFADFSNGVYFIQITSRNIQQRIMKN